jgi:hypothetical protein
MSLFGFLFVCFFVWLLIKGGPAAWIVFAGASLLVAVPVLIAKACRGIGRACGHLRQRPWRAGSPPPETVRAWAYFAAAVALPLCLSIGNVVLRHYGWLADGPVR